MSYHSEGPREDFEQKLGKIQLSVFIWLNFFCRIIVGQLVAKTILSIPISSGPAGFRLLECIYTHVKKDEEQVSRASSLNLAFVTCLHFLISGRKSTTLYYVRSGFVPSLPSPAVERASNDELIFGHAPLNLSPFLLRWAATSVRLWKSERTNECC